MSLQSIKRKNRLARHKRIRAKIIGTAERPRISIFRSNRHLIVQIIDDESRRTLVSSKIASGAKGKLKGTKTEIAKKIGELVAKSAQEKGISKVIFDKGGFKYHGRVKALADSMRSGGLIF